MRALLIAAATPFIFLAAPASAQVVNDDMAVQITITKECATTMSVNDLNFGSHGVLDANIDVATTMSFTCTKDTPYTITMGNGLTGASPTARVMTNAGESVQYSLFRDAGRTQNWGNVAGPDALTGTATGSLQTIDIYGRVPVQATPVAATYTDTVQVSLTY